MLAGNNRKQGLLRYARGKESRSRAALLSSWERIEIESRFATLTGNNQIKDCFSALAGNNRDQGLLRYARRKESRSRAALLCSQEGIEIKGWFAMLTGNNRDQGPLRYAPRKESRSRVASLRSGKQSKSRATTLTGKEWWSRAFQKLWRARFVCKRFHCIKSHQSFS